MRNLLGEELGLCVDDYKKRRGHGFQIFLTVSCVSPVEDTSIEEDVNG